MTARGVSPLGPPQLVSAARRRPRTAKRALARALIGCALLLASLLAPAGVDDFTNNDDASPAGVAHAQTPTPVVDGTPSNCAVATDPLHSYWTAYDELCVLDIPSCPFHPAIPGRFLAISSSYPGFCEEFLAGPTGVTNCTRTVTEQRPDPNTGILTSYTVPALQGAIRLYDLSNPSGGCTLLNLRTCEAGRTKTDRTCELIERRTWTCPTSYTPMNQFNKCYRPPNNYTGAHPACQAGSPSFPIAGYCETYVDQDFVRSPNPSDCGNFEVGPAGQTMSANTQTGISSDYWCEYDASLFDVTCHPSAPALPRRRGA